MKRFAGDDGRVTGGTALPATLIGIPLAPCSFHDAIEVSAQLLRGDAEEAGRGPHEAGSVRAGRWRPVSHQVPHRRLTVGVRWRALDCPETKPTRRLLRSSSVGRGRRPVISVRAP